MNDTPEVTREITITNHDIGAFDCVAYRIARAEALTRLVKAIASCYDELSDEFLTPLLSVVCDELQYVSDDADDIAARLCEKFNGEEGDR